MGYIPSLEDCNPGISPVEYNVVIAPEDVEEKTKGGIIITDAKKDEDQAAKVKGRLVAISPLAFNYDEWPADARKPQVGDAVVFAKYAGILVEGLDGKEYRVMKDKDLMAVLTA